MIPTVDVSQYQGQINFAVFPYEVLIMKLSGGDNGLYTDVWAYYNYDQAKHKHGKSIIQYHFAGGTDPIAEANYFYKVAQPLELYDVFALDWEIEHADPVNWVLSFITQFHSLCGVYPIVYMDIDRLDRFDWSPVLALCGLWIGAPSFTFNQDVPTNGHPYVIQQGATISVPGISNAVDSDAIWLTIDQLNKYGWQGNPPVATSTTTTTTTTTETTSTTTSESTSSSTSTTTTIPPEPTPKPHPTPPKPVKISFWQSIRKWIKKWLHI